MAKRRKNVRELGDFKPKITSALFASDDIKHLLLGDFSSMTSEEVKRKFKTRAKSHLFIDETVTDAESFLYYDVYLPEIHGQIKECKLIVQTMCHRDIIEKTEDIFDLCKSDEEDISDKYIGNRADIFVQMIEDVLLNDDIVIDFGIGELVLDRVGLYNSTRFYGHVMEFSVPNFR